MKLETVLIFAVGFIVLEGMGFRLLPADYFFSISRIKSSII